MSETMFARASVDIPFAAPSKKMIGMTVGTCPSIASNPVPTNWAMKMPATMDRAPSHAAIGTNARRPATCIAPIHPTIAAASAAVYPY